MKREMAFWKYDLYPYCLWGEVVHATEGSDIVAVKNYGTVRVLTILPYDEGQKIAARLQKLSDEYRRREAALKAKFRRNAFAVASFIDQPKEAQHD